MSAPQFPAIPTSNQQPDQPLAHPVPSTSQEPPPPSPTQPSPPVSGSMAKEVAPPINKNIHQPETAPIIEIKETEPLPPEVEGWLQKLDQEGDIQLPQPITDDGNVLLSEPPGQTLAPKIILPLTKSGVQAGLKTKVTDSAKWLANWCLRLIKMMKDEVKYAPETIKEQSTGQVNHHDEQH